MKLAPDSDTSRLRREILRIEKEHDERIETVLGERGPMIRGSFVRQGRRCGKPTCRCARGELHEAALLTASEEGRGRSIHVPREEQARVEERAGRYRSFRRARADLVSLGRRLLRAVDELQRALTEPYLPGDRGGKRRQRSRRKEG